MNTDRQTMPDTVEVILDEPGMQSLAAQLAKHLIPPLVIHLHGDLGAGKTTFTRALIQGTGYTGRVKSPTYGLMEYYPTGELEFLHLDLYRIGDSGELEFLGITDLLNERTVLLVEWPDHGKGALPEADLSLHIDHHDERRLLVFKAYSRSGNQVLHSLHDLIK